MDLSDLQPSDLIPEERSAMSRYKAAEGEPGGLSPCFDLNRLLEQGLFPDEMWELGDSLRALDSVLGRTPKLADGITAYRAVGTRLHYPFSEPGKQFRNLAFWSTSTERHAAMTFLKAPASGSHGALLTLTLPVGLPVPNMSRGSDHEREILLPRGILWTVGDCKLADKDKLGLLPAVKVKFQNVAEVTLLASPSFRPPR